MVQNYNTAWYRFTVDPWLFTSLIQTQSLVQLSRFMVYRHSDVHISKCLRESMIPSYAFG